MCFSRKAAAVQSVSSAGEPLSMLLNQEPGMDMDKPKWWGQLGAVRTVSCRLPS